MDRTSKFKCLKCGKGFSRSTNLRRHVRNQHPDEPTEKLAPPKKGIGPFACSECKNHFSHKANLSRHIITVHKNDRISTGKLKCPICKNNFTKKEITVHFENEHNIKIVKSKKRFTSFEEFLKFKTDFEKYTKSRFVKKNSHSSKKFVFPCHRNGTYTSDSKGIRQLKVQGTSKIGGYCPAQILVCKESIDNVDVTIVETHVGHECELKFLTLTNEEREYFAKLIEKKMSFAEILKQVRSSVASNAAEDNLQRSHLVTRQDLCNIARSYGLSDIAVKNKTLKTVTKSAEQQEIRKDTEDVWVRELGPDGLFYKPQNFCNPHYDGMKVTNISTDGTLQEHVTTIEIFAQNPQVHETEVLFQAITHPTNEEAKMMLTEKIMEIKSISQEIQDSIVYLEEADTFLDILKTAKLTLATVKDEIQNSLHSFTVTTERNPTVVEAMLLQEFPHNGN